jgi:hypothetical protein
VVSKENKRDEMLAACSAFAVAACAGAALAEDA